VQSIEHMTVNSNNMEWIVRRGGRLYLLPMKVVRESSSAFMNVV